MTLVRRSTADKPRVLVVEDDFLIAEHLRILLEDGGYEVVGPVSTVREALGHLESPILPDAAVLDVNLSGDWVYPVADALGEKGVRYVLTSGYDPAFLPSRFRAAPSCSKPIDPRQLLAKVMSVCAVHT